MPVVGESFYLLPAAVLADGTDKASSPDVHIRSLSAPRMKRMHAQQCYLFGNSVSVLKVVVISDVNVRLAVFV